MKLCHVKILILLIISVQFMAPSRNAVDTVVMSEFPARSLHNVSKKTFPDGTTGYVVKDIDYTAHADPLTTDLLLKFDREPDRYLKDDSGKYNIYSASYELVRDGIGNGSASFFKKDHVMMINTSEGLWLGSVSDLGSFNIEFRFKAAEIRNGSVLFSCTGYFSGIKKGIEVRLNGSGVSAYLHNIFRTPKGELKSASLTRGPGIAKGRWHHFSLSFDRQSGKLSKLIDGQETDVRYMTSSGGAFTEVYSPLFGYIDAEDGSSRGTDLPLAVIGKDYNGLIDEFRISYSHFDRLRQQKDIALTRHKGSEYAGRIPYNREGVITSPVTEFPSTGTSITDFLWEEVLNPGTFIWMEFRISDKYFSEADNTLKWYRVTRRQRNTYLARGSDGEYLRGRYFQWRAHLAASPEGDSTPVMKNVSVRYRTDSPPITPLSVEVAEAGDRYVVIRWKKNVEADLGGYRVYYGTKKGAYDGIITTINGQKITNAGSSGNYVSVRIDNPAIDENKNLDKRNVLVYPSIENTVLYYFSVTSYDNYREGTVYNHESELSQYVHARPFAGSDIR